MQALPEGNAVVIPDGNAGVVTEINCGVLQGTPVKVSVAGSDEFGVTIAVDG